VPGAVSTIPFLWVHLSQSHSTCHSLLPLCYFTWGILGWNCSCYLFCATLCVREAGNTCLPGWDWTCTCCHLPQVPAGPACFTCCSLCSTYSHSEGGGLEGGPGWAGRDSACGFYRSLMGVPAMPYLVSRSAFYTCLPAITHLEVGEYLPLLPAILGGHHACTFCTLQATTPPRHGRDTGRLDNRRRHTVGPFAVRSCSLPPPFTACLRLVSLRFVIDYTCRFLQILPVFFCHLLYPLLDSACL